VRGSLYVEMQASMGNSRTVGRVHLSDLHTLPHGETMKARNHDELILEFEETLLRFEANGIRHSKEDPEYRKMYKADLRDLKKGLGLMKQGKYTKAYEWISGLDTNVREIPPDSVWEKLVASRGWQE
jgi:hypothetical protein